MVKVKSWLFTEVRGKVKKAEFRRRKNKITELSQKRIPFNPRTEAQQKIRKAYGQCVEEWNKLSEAEKREWRIIGTLRGISGYNAFMQDCIPKKIGAIWYEITIDNSANSNDLTYYQVLLEITNDATFFEDCKNEQKYLEFYDTDKATLLNHFVEEFDTTNKNAKIWIKVPYIPANSTKTIYLKINTSRTTDLSDGEAVFEFFDDFDEGTTPNPDKWSSQGTPSISESCLILDAADEHVYSDGSEGHTADTYLIYECKAYVDSRFSFNVIKPDEKQILSSGSYGFATLYWNNLYTQTGNGGRTEVDRGAYTTDEWKIIKIIYLPDKVKWELPEGNFEHTTQIPDPSQSMHIGIWTTADGYTNKIDWVRVRKYTEPEPTVSYSKTS